MDSVEKQMNDIVKKLDKMAYEYDLSINKKEILKRAANPAVGNLKARATSIKKTGRLASSVKFVIPKAKRAVYVGYDYKMAQHGVLIEYGWTKRNGQYKSGYGLVKKTYEATKAQILKNLIVELERVTRSTLNKIKVA
jgi:hypothetical protein